MINSFRVIIKNGIWIRVPAHLVKTIDEAPCKRFFLNIKELSIKDKNEVVKDRKSATSSQVHGCV